MFKLIAPGISPNAELDDVLFALFLILRPWHWQDKQALEELNKWFSLRYYPKKVYPVNAGRSALYLLLQSAGIGKGDEVLVQTFTCIGAIEPIIWLGAKPVYVDIEESSFNIDPLKLTKKINKKTKAIIVQHTFGLPAKMQEIIRIAKDHKILVIEDCAHSLGAKIAKSEIGTFGDAAFFSFGRDKIVSSVFGGVALINQPAFFKDIESLYEKIPMSENKWVLQQLLHPFLLSFILPFYNLQIGKIILLIAQKSGLLSKPYSREEFLAQKPSNYPERMSPALAKLALHQLNKLSKFNQKRREIAKNYGTIKEGAVYLRYPILVDDPQKICRLAKKNGILLGRWYSNIIDPKGINLEKFMYKLGSCPVAEAVAGRIINLPTYPKMTKADVLKIKKILNK